MTTGVFYMMNQRSSRDMKHILQAAKVERRLHPAAGHVLLFMVMVLISPNPASSQVQDAAVRLFIFFLLNFWFLMVSERQIFVSDVFLQCMHVLNVWEMFVFVVCVVCVQHVCMYVQYVHNICLCVAWVRKVCMCGICWTCTTKCMYVYKMYVCVVEVISLWLFRQANFVLHAYKENSVLSFS